MDDELPDASDAGVEHVVWVGEAGPEVLDLPPGTTVHRRATD